MIGPARINLPEIVAEVRAAFLRYERAFVENDIAVLDELFWPSRFVVRYGRSENLYGIEAIRAFRAARPAAGLMRELSNTVITTFDRDFATASTEFRLASSEVRGRQSQTWVRIVPGWRIVAAHASLIGSGE